MGNLEISAETRRSVLSELVVGLWECRGKKFIVEGLLGLGLDLSAPSVLFWFAVYLVPAPMSLDQRVLMFSSRLASELRHGPIFRCL